MRTSVNDSKYCLDDRYGIVYVLTKYERLAQVLDSRIAYVGDYDLTVYKVLFGRLTLANLLWIF
jgi:hypothetical protein